MKRQLQLLVGLGVVIGCLWSAAPWAASAPTAAEALRGQLQPQPQTRAGQSATQLADGRWLLLGGVTGASGVSADASVTDVKTGQAVALTSRLATARSGHTATLLPDGAVLILGGIGANGAAVAEAERFNPATQSFESLGNLGNTARSGHSGTVLSDGRLLIIGGADARGLALSQAELLDLPTMRLQSFDARLDTAQMNHIAALLPDSNVLVLGGIDGTGQALPGGELFESATQRFSGVNTQAAQRLVEPLVGASAPALVDTVPGANAQNVPIDQRIIVRLSKRMDVSTLTEQTVTLLGPNGQTLIKPVAVEGGLLLFVTPRQELLPASRYTLFIQGAADQFGQALPFTAVGFSTGAVSVRGGANAATAGVAIVSPAEPAAALPPALDTTSANASAIAQAEPAAAAAGDDDEAWIPDARHRKGNWVSGRGRLAKQALPLRASLRRVLHDPHHEDSPRDYAALRAALDTRSAEAQAVQPEQTALTGQVLRLNGRPLANVTVQMDGITTQTDAQGEFVLTGINPGENRMFVVDGQSANRPNAKYGRFMLLANVLADRMNHVRDIVWMPKLDTANAVDIPSPTVRETIITNPNLPGLELVLPAGTVIRDAHGKIVTQLTITPYPVDQPPFPIPFVDVPISYTIQPGGAVIQGVDGKPKAAVLRYPNYSAFGPGHLTRLLDYDPNGRGWYVYGFGQVSADGQRIVSSREFGIYQFTANMASSGGQGSDTSSPQKDDPKPPKKCNCANAGSGGTGGDPVDLLTGHFEKTETDMVVADIVPLTLQRTYRTLDKVGTTAIVRPFGIGATHDYEIFLEYGGSPAAWTLVLPNSTRVRFTSAGAFSPSDYINTDTPGEFYQAILHYDTSAANGYAYTLYFRDGRRWNFPWQNARLRWTEDRNGNRVTLTRNVVSGYVSQILSPTGRYINLSYNTYGQVSQATDHTGRSVTYGYDTGQRLTTVTDPNGGIKTYNWDTTNNRVTSIKDARNNTILTNAYYATDGRVQTQTMGDGSTFGFAYTLTGGAVTRTDVTDRRGQVRRADFNATGRIVTDTFPLGVAGQEQITTFVLDPATGRMTSVTDGLGRQTTYQYDGLGNVTQATRLAGTANAVSTVMTYDTAYSNLLTYKDPNNKTTTLSYDAQGNVTQVSDPLSHTRQFTYDAQGRVLTVKDGLNVTIATATYSGADLTSVADALSRTTTLTYDGAGRLVGIRDPLGRYTTSTYDVLDRLTKTTRPMGDAIQFTYDPSGNLLTYVDPNTNTTTYTYDTFNRTATRQDALSKTETYGYEGGGQLNKVTDRKSQVSGTTYDAVGRVSQRGFGATTAAPTTYTSTIGYTWDKGNRLSQLVDSVGGTITRTYDGLDRVLTEVTTQGTATYTYDAAGRRATMVVTGQPTVTYTWDDANRLTQIQQAAGAINNSVAQTIGFTYDNADRRTKTTLANGSTINYVYDNASQLSSITYRKGDATLIGDLVYTYDNAGRRVTTTGSLAEINLPNTVASALYNANNQLTSWAGTTYTYDLNGNLTNDGSLTYAWDARDQLASLSGGSTASFNYDGFGRRYGKTVGGITTGFVYDGMNFVQEKNGTGGTATPTANVITGFGFDETFARMTGTGASAVISSFLPDANNNTIRLLNGAQTVTDTYAYEAYGKTTVTGTSGNAQQYTGRENDATGLYFYRARYYHPTAGRFVSEDPIEFGGGANVYAYVEANPISFSDPLGLVKDPTDNRNLIPLAPGAVGGPPIPPVVVRLPVGMGPPPNPQGLMSKYPVLKTNPETIICRANGGFPQATRDFDQFTQGLPQKSYPNGIRSAELPDGTTLSVRPFSGKGPDFPDGAPTIQINPAGGGPTVKIRY